MHTRSECACNFVCVCFFFRLESSSRFGPIFSVQQALRKNVQCYAVVGLAAERTGQHILANLHVCVRGAMCECVLKVAAPGECCINPSGYMFEHTVHARTHTHTLGDADAHATHWAQLHWGARVSRCWQNNTHPASSEHKVQLTCATATTGRQSVCECVCAHFRSGECECGGGW